MGACGSPYLPLLCGDKRGRWEVCWEDSEVATRNDTHNTVAVSEGIVPVSRELLKLLLKKEWLVISQL